MLLGSRGDIEHRGLSAVGISDERNIYGLYSSGIVAMHGMEVVTLGNGVYVRGICEFVILRYRNYFHKVGLAAAKRQLVAHQTVFYRILQGCIKNHLYNLALDKTHLYHSFTKCAMTENLDNYSRFSGL